MTVEKAERLVRDRFWKFHNKLVEEFPEYRSIFDQIVTEAQQYGLLWEVLEFADIDLGVIADSKGGANNLLATDYLEALEYGYSEWIK
jgi:hypothetical protein